MVDKLKMLIIIFKNILITNRFLSVDNAIFFYL